WVMSTAVIDVDNTRRAKAESFLDTNPRPAADNEAGTVAMEFTFPDVNQPTGSTTIASGADAEKLSADVPGHPEWETSPHQKAEEFSRAVALALFDYLRKSRSQGFVVSLSGGADSTTVAVLIHLLVQLGSRELGFDKFTAKLSHIG